MNQEFSLIYPDPDSARRAEEGKDPLRGVRKKAFGKAHEVCRGLSTSFDYYIGIRCKTQAFREIFRAAPEKCGIFIDWNRIKL